MTVISAGIDIGSLTTEIFILENEKPKGKICFSSAKLLDNLKKVEKKLKEFKVDLTICAFGYGLPVKKLSDLTDFEVFLATLNLEDEIFGIRKFIEYFRKKEMEIYTIPGVIHLPTVPVSRKINKIDMGTPDKVASVALAMYEQLSELEVKKQNFILVESGYGFNSFIGVKNGKIVDGLGGTSGFISFLSPGCIDGEVAYLLQGFKKNLLFNSGFMNFLGEKISDIGKLPSKVINWICEYLLKGIKVMEVSTNTNKVLVSGRLFKNYKIFKRLRDASKKFGYEIKKLKGFGLSKQSAEGAAIIANGLAGGSFKKIVDSLKIKKASGTCIDYLTPSFRHLIIAKVKDHLKN